MSGTFELSQSSNDKFMFNLKAGNGQVILTSQMYESRAGALQGIESVKTNAARHMIGLHNGLPGARRWRQLWSDHRLKHLPPREVWQRGVDAAEAAVQALATV